MDEKEIQEWLTAHPVDCKEAEKPSEIIQYLLSEVRKFKTEITSILDHLGKNHVIKCCEGGGPENIIGTLALSVANLKQDYLELQRENENLKTERNKLGKYKSSSDAYQKEVEAWKEICRKRDLTVKKQGEDWAILKTEIDEYKNLVSKLQERKGEIAWLDDLLECFNCGPDVSDCDCGKITCGFNHCQEIARTKTQENKK